MDKPILKLFWPPDRPIVLVFLWLHASILSSKENPVSGGAKYTGVGKSAIFDWNRRLSRKQYEIAHGYYGTLIGSHKWRIDMCRFWWPWVTQNPGFIVELYCYKSNISKMQWETESLHYSCIGRCWLHDRKGTRPVKISHHHYNPKGSDLKDLRENWANLEWTAEKQAAALLAVW